MTKLDTLNKELLEARKAKNDLVKNLLLTFKGEYENAVKTGSNPGDELVEKIAKKMIKSAEAIGTEDAKMEIEVLNNYMPQMLSEDEVRSIVSDIVSSKPGLNVGAYMGQIMKTGKAIDPKMAMAILNELTTA